MCYNKRSSTWYKDMTPCCSLKPKLHNTPWSEPTTTTAPTQPLASVPSLLTGQRKLPFRPNVSSNEVVAKYSVGAERRKPPTLVWASSRTYWAVEDHEALVEVVMLHGGVAVQLGQWVVTPGTTHRVNTVLPRTLLHRTPAVWGRTSGCRSCWLLCGPGRGRALQSSAPEPPDRSDFSVKRWMGGLEKGIYLSCDSSWTDPNLQPN